MSEVVQNTQQEFWRPPAPLAADEIIVREAVPAMAETCPRCSSEFLLGSRFCHTCGERRREAMSPTARADAAIIAGVWEQGVARTYSVAARLASRKTWSDLGGKIQFPAWLRYLHFHEIQSRVGLSTASLIAFVIGLGCVAGALVVGLLTAKTFVDWQAIQFYRAEWLLAATAAFVGGILLKKPSGRDGE
jgi:hypothetical protein